MKEATSCNINSIFMKIFEAFVCLTVLSMLIGLGSTMEKKTDGNPSPLIVEYIKQYKVKANDLK
jgi:hypothetical protein